MDFYQNRYYDTTRRFMVLIGQWPYDQTKFKHFRRILILFFGVSFAHFQILKLLNSRIDIDLFLEIFTPLIISMLCYSKYLTCWYNADIVKQLLDQIKYDWSLVKHSGEQKLLEKYADDARFFVFVYMLFMYAGLSVFISVPFLPGFLDIVLPLNESRARLYPLEAEYLLDKEKYFYLIIVHMLTTVVVVLTIAASTDFVFISIVLHGCGIFAVLGYRLEHIFDDFEMKRDEACKKSRKTSLYRRIAACVDTHKKSIEYVGVVNSCYARSSVLQLVLTLFILSSILLKMVESLMAMANLDAIIVCTVHATGYIFLGFLNVLPAQMLLDSSANIFYKAYSSQWYTAPFEVQRLLILIMRKSMQPCGLTAANVLTSSLEVFAAVIQTSLSYFTVLYSVRQS